MCAPATPLLQSQGFWGFKSGSDCEEYVAFGNDGWAIFYSLVWSPAGVMFVIAAVAAYLVFTVKDNDAGHVGDLELK